MDESGCTIDFAAAFVGVGFGITVDFADLLIGMGLCVAPSMVLTAKLIRYIEHQVNEINLYKYT